MTHPMTDAPDESGFTPFIDMIAAHAASSPDGIAFRQEDRTLRWKPLHRQVVQVAGALVVDGVLPGDKVAVLGYPSLVYAESLLGIVAARACVVPLPVSASVETIETMLADCEAKLLFLDPAAGDAFVSMAERLAVSGGLRVVRFGEDGTEGDEYGAWRERGDGDASALPRALLEDAFNIIYSSGTTGLPKGIVHQHGMRRRQAQRNGFGFGPDGRTLLSTPMYSNTTIIPMLGTLANGGQTVLMRKFDAGRYLALATAHRVTHTMLVPVQYKRILAHPDFAAADLSAFQVSQSTGAPMPATLKREILDRWPGRFVEGYGMTEGGVACFLDARAHPDKLATVGAPVPGTEAWLIDADGRRMDAGGGATGEVVGRSPFMMASYHNRPEATADIRWYDEAGRMFHRTGDIGRFDADGFLTLLDRTRDMIISGGNNIFAADLEAVLVRHPDVADCAVIGVPSEQWGETPLALVVLRPGAQANGDVVRDWVNKQVGKTQRLSAVELRGDLPRNPLGKLSKKELRGPYWQRESTA